MYHMDIIISDIILALEILISNGSLFNPFAPVIVYS